MENKNHITINDVRNEVIEILKKVIKAEYCPYCKEIQSMFIIYHIEQDSKSFPPKISESLRCPGCLKLFENKLEEVQKHKDSNKGDMGFKDFQKTLLPKPKEENNKIKKEGDSEDINTSC